MENSFKDSDSMIEIKDILEKLPSLTGVYLMKDRQGKIIYIGKAKNLRQRVKSYFIRSGDERAFISHLPNILDDIETIVTRSEKEALLLENNLIKQHHPKFNVRLIDDKNYLALRLDTRLKYPRLEVVRKIIPDGAKYFGPYQVAHACREALEAVNRYFKLRTCSDSVFSSRKRPCLQYQIKRCDAPCVYEIPVKNYAQQVKEVSLFLEGKNKELIETLHEKLSFAAKNLDFEVAASVRDQIHSLKNILENQQMVSSRFVHQDVIGCYREGDKIEMTVLHIRQGKLNGRKSYFLKNQEFPEEEVLSSFLGQYYDENPVPEEIILPFIVEDLQVKQEWLNDQRQKNPCAPTNLRKKLKLLCPVQGPMRKLVALANQNAQISFQSRRESKQNDQHQFLKLKERLGLKNTPRRIECVDISHLQGEGTVAGFVVFIDGEPAKKEYRTFLVRSVKNNDFGAMYEVVSRRLRRSMVEEPGKEKWPIPDLLVIDGGKGQLSSAMAAVKDQGFSEQDFDVISLAKERENTKGEKQIDRIFLHRQKDPILLKNTSSELFIISKIRDEAHRYSLKYQQKKRGQRLSRSILLEIDGIGKERMRGLLKKFGSLSGIANATIQELDAILKNQEIAARVKEFLTTRYKIGTETDVILQTGTQNTDQEQQVFNQANDELQNVLARDPELEIK